MCCLGFVALTCGYAGFRGVADWSGLEAINNPIYYALVDYNEDERGIRNAQLGRFLMKINDDVDITNETREYFLTVRGREAGINFTFVD